MIAFSSCFPLSVLFSEPKISQRVAWGGGAAGAWPFSALQRAENFSTGEVEYVHYLIARLSVLFSEPKISQRPPRISHDIAHACPFSALQRAENFSTVIRYTMIAPEFAFQCSSASRKFLNTCRHKAFRVLKSLSVLFSEPKISQPPEYEATPPRARPFSALQRAENFSTHAA